MKRRHRLLDPTDGETPLARGEIEPGLIGFLSANGGAWLRFADYDRWLSAKNRLPTVSQASSQATEDMLKPVEDSPAGKLCPEDGAFLIRCRVVADLPFYLDRCGHCGGVWFDAHEWIRVREAGLSDSLGLVFTDAYQSRVRQQLQEQSAEARLRGVLGDADYDRVVDFAAWLRDHPKQHMARALLDQAMNEESS